jgi:hypothetical protein
MAKRALIEREKKRARLVQKYAAKRSAAVLHFQPLPSSGDGGLRVGMPDFKML